MQKSTLLEWGYQSKMYIQISKAQEIWPLFSRWLHTCMACKSGRPWILVEIMVISITGVFWQPLFADQHCSLWKACDTYKWGQPLSFPLGPVTSSSQRLCSDFPAGFNFLTDPSCFSTLLASHPPVTCLGIIFPSLFLTRPALADHPFSALCCSFLSVHQCKIWCYKSLGNIRIFTVFSLQFAFDFPVPCKRGRDAWHPSVKFYRPQGTVLHRPRAPAGGGCGEHSTLSSGVPREVRGLHTYLDQGHPGSCSCGLGCCQKCRWLSSPDVTLAWSRSFWLLFAAFLGGPRADNLLSGRDIFLKEQRGRL